MKSVTDWREHYDSHPYVALGVALSSGLVIGALLAGPRSRSRASAWNTEVVRLAAPRTRSTSERQQLLRNCISVAVAAYKVAEGLYRVLPAFRSR